MPDSFQSGSTQIHSEEASKALARRQFDIDSTTWPNTKGSEKNKAD